MATKYTILKVLIRNLSKSNHFKNGFTLIELIVGLLIMSIVGGLAMNAFIQASKNFSDDKKNIDSSQNLSAVLEMIGADVRQAGEQINDAKFPVIKIEPNTDADNMPNSSKVTIRRALTSTLTLCEEITTTFTGTTLVVADDSLSESNCKIGTAVSTTTLPTTITRPTALREARNKRCQLDDINGNYTVADTDFCLSTKATPDLEQVSAAMSDRAGNIRTFKYLDDGLVPATTNKYQISVSGLSASTVTYSVGKPIYLIEERVYKLNSDGSFKLQVDGGTVETLIKGIQTFKVSARVYGNTDTKASDPIDRTAALVVSPSVLPISRRCDASIAYYICDFNNSSVDDWKTLQGIKVELQAKYDPTGRSATASAIDTEKLSAKAEFFPRNVLSK